MKLFSKESRARLLLSSLLLCLPGAAQISGGVQPLVSYKLIEVKVTGSKRFTQQEIVAASGLPVGTIAHEEDFKKAARQLGETGAFGVINFTYTYSSAGTRLEFQVTDADKFVPAHFADFVWFTDEELHKKLHDRVPLFDGELPGDGRLPDQISDVLQALLVENGVPGIVQYVRTEGKDQRLQSIDYNVAGVSIRIHRAQFPGAGAAELPLLQAAAEKLSDREYSRDYMTNFVEHSVLPLYQERGYLRASCAQPQPKVVKPAAADSADNKQPPTYVDITFPITQGIQYKVTQWDWSDNKAIPKDELDPFLHAKAGQAANTVQLANDLRQIQTLYGSRGYILATIKVNAEFDDVSETVFYHLIVHEDSLYHMGDLEFRGIDNSLTARLRAAWKLRPGDVYDATYLKQFLPEARKLLPPTLDWDVDPHVTAITRDKTVDVDLQYTAKAAP
ncbi:MAG: POTRA domain-containing protein [Candidatus Sulfotelmatobacter sp.]|jgi:outer membrane protein insertion porin family